MYTFNCVLILAILVTNVLITKLVHAKKYILRSFWHIRRGSEIH